MFLPLNSMPERNSFSRFSFDSAISNNVRTGTVFNAACSDGLQEILRAGGKQHVVKEWLF